MGLIFRLFRLFASGNFRGLFTVLLGLTLVWGLWETSLVRLSSRDASTAIMTQVGVELINPLLIHNSLGLSQTAYSTLERTAQAHPTQSFSVPGIKIKFQGSDIAGKSFAEGSSAIYARVAGAYYDGGAQGVFDVPSQLTSVLGQIALLPQLAASQGAKAAGVPQLPNVPLPPLGVIGLSPQLLTASGHDGALNLDKWLLGAAAIFALLLMVFSPRLHRISSVAWSVLTGALPGVLVLGIIWFFWNRNPDLFRPYAQLLNLLGGVFLPVYGGAFAVGAGGLVVAKVGDLALKAAGVGQRGPARAGGFSASPPRRPAAGSAAGAYGQASWIQQPETPQYRPYGSGSASGPGAGSGAAGTGAAWGQDRTWDMPPAATPQRQPGGAYGAPSYGGADFGQGGQAWPGAAGAQGGWGQPGQGGQAARPQPAEPAWGQGNQPGQGGWGQQGSAVRQGGTGLGQSGQASQGGWDDAPPWLGYGQGGQGRPQSQPGGQGSGGQGGQGQQRGGWPPTGDDDPWVPRR
jgi:hypothetical protein